MLTNMIGFEANCTCAAYKPTSGGPFAPGAACDSHPPDGNHTYYTNACGIHIHTLNMTVLKNGTSSAGWDSCKVANGVTGHFFNKTTPENATRDDPWTGADGTYYTFAYPTPGSSEPNTSKIDKVLLPRWETYLTNDTGFSTQDFEGKAFVVHDPTGGRIGCGMIHVVNEHASGARSFFATMTLLFVSIFLMVVRSGAWCSHGI